MSTPTLPAERYVSAAAWSTERERIFRRCWTVLAPAARLPRVRDQLAVEVAGWPLVLVRAEDGIRGFFNVCRHRAGPLVHEQAHGERLRCRYHGWQYDLRGRRVATPDFGGPCPQADLVAIRVQEWGGLVFGAIAPDESLEAALGELPEELAAIDLEGFSFHAHVEHELACNWKTYAENYLEGYHIPHVHPQLAAEVDVRRYAVRAGSRHVAHEVPMRQASAYEGYWAFLWPSVAINVYGQGLSIERILPTGPQTMRIAYDFLFLDDADEAVRAAALEASHRVTTEDVAIVEAVQRGLASGAYNAGWLSPKHEAGVAAFQRWVFRATA